MCSLSAKSFITAYGNVSCTDRNDAAFKEWSSHTSGNLLPTGLKSTSEV